MPVCVGDYTVGMLIYLLSWCIYLHLLMSAGIANHIHTPTFYSVILYFFGLFDHVILRAQDDIDSERIRLLVIIILCVKSSIYYRLEEIQKLLSQLCGKSSEVSTIIANITSSNIINYFISLSLEVNSLYTIFL